jgi:hypothetical protein
MTRKLLLTVAAAILAGALALPSLAAEEKTITGEGKCGKCALKETKTCQNVVQVKEKDKTVTYYLADNDVSKKFHDNICKETKKVTVTGTVKKVDGKMELTPTKIELAKQ